MDLHVQQIEGTAARSVRLRGPAGPRIDGTTLGRGMQRAAIHWPNHATRAEVTLLGPEEGEAEFSFRWRGREIGGTRYALVGDEPAASVEDLRRYVDRMRIDSALVLVELGELQRVGYIAAFEARPGYAHEYDATLTVQWVETEPNLARQASARPDPVALHEEMAAAWDAGIVEVAEPLTAQRAAGEDVDEGIADTVAGLDRLGDVANDPSAASNGGVGSALQAARSGAVAILTGLQVPPGDLVQSDDPGTRLLARLYQARLGALARAVRDRAAAERSTYGALEDPAVLGVHEALDGETIWSVALVWYGTAEAAAVASISRANELHGVRLRAGQRVIIPRRHA